MQAKITTRTTCRICGSGLKDIFSLGELYLSNFLAAPDSVNEPKAPLTVALCQNCELLQLRHTIPQDLMYRNYWYKSGINPVIVEDLKEIVKKSIKIIKPKRYNIFLDIGSNDNSLLNFVPKRFIRFGCEPAQNFLKELKNNEIYINDFWSYKNYVKAFEKFKIKTTNPKIANSNPQEWADKISSYSNFHKWLYYHFGKANHCDSCGDNESRAGNKNGYEWSNKTGKYKKRISNWWQLCKKCHRKFDGVKRIEKIRKAKIITVIGMGYDLIEPLEFIGDIKKALADDGIIIFQLMGLKHMLAKNDFSNITMEHIEYYSYKSLVYLFEKSGLEIVNIEENNINGGSYRLFAKHYQKGSIQHEEPEIDYNNFIKQIEENKKQTVDFIKQQVSEGKKVYGYGASTKGNTVLQYYELDSAFITAIADKNPEKWGKFTVGTHIPIVSEEEARKDADYFWILPWGFTDYFVERERAAKYKGKFIVCAPHFRII